MPVPSPHDPLGLLGQTLDGRYLLRDVLGTGDTGVVYSGEHLALRRACAIKVLHPQVQRDATRLQSIVQGSRLAAQAGCDRLIVADDILSGANLTAFVMPLLQGEDLAAHLRRTGALPWGQVRHLALAMGGALRDLHARGLVFGGLKPSNVFLPHAGGPDCDVRLLDVGISRHDAQTASAAYISPEQVQAGTLDARSDLYSFAVLLHELLTGQPVFVGTPVQVAQMHRFKPARSPGASGVALPPAVDELLLAALAKAPAARPDLHTLLGAVARARIAPPGGAPAVQESQTLAGTTRLDDAPTRTLSITPSVRRAAPAPSFRAGGPPIDEESTTQFLSAPLPATLSRSGELDDLDQGTRPIPRRPPEEHTQRTPAYTPRPPPSPPPPPVHRPAPPPTPSAPPTPRSPPPPPSPPGAPAERTELSRAHGREQTVLSPAPRPPSPAPPPGERTVPSPANLAPQPSAPLWAQPVPGASPERTVPSPANLAPQPPPLIPGPAPSATERILAPSTQRTEVLAFPPARPPDGTHTAMIPGFGGAVLSDPGNAPALPSRPLEPAVPPPRPPSRLWARLRALFPARATDKPGFWARFRSAPADNRLPARRTPAWLDTFLRGLAELPRRIGALWRRAARPFASLGALRSRFSTPLAALRSSVGKLWRMITRYTGSGTP